MMPGVLIMNDENANGVQTGNQLRKQSTSTKQTETPLLATAQQQQQQASSSAPLELLQAVTTSSVAPASSSVDQPSVNGDHIVQQLDETLDPQIDIQGRVAADEERVSQVGKVSIPESILARPPNIEHITTGFQPMSKLIDRVTQECFNELVDLINQLADETDQAPAGMVNGTSGFATGPNSSGASASDVSRRVRMMEFANKHRERVIKLLVLLQWSRQVEDVSTMIDLWNWYRTQIGYHDEAAEWVGRLRISTSRAKQPNPDIQTALEVLSKGKASWISDLDYIPPKPLSPEKLLRILRNINSLLSVRLIVHDDVPYLMRHWTVASGRVTFTVPEEFELDLSLANEDPSSQLYFIDLRLLFSPTSDLPETYFKGYLENEVNKVLATTRLSGCYEFLHNFVLTHKISILRRQAQAMAAGTWAKAIKVESVHRLLIVQYWLDSIHTKSWIEIGIVSRKLKGKRAWSPAQTPRISMRWIRGGIEVCDVEHCLDLKNLSMENALNKVIALHKSYILEGIHDRLQQHSDPSGRALRMELQTPDPDSADCRLKMRLGIFGNERSVIVDTFTGRLSFIPLLHVPPRLDQEIQSLKNPASDAHRSVGNVICNDLHAAVEKKAINYGWQVIRNAEAKVEKGASVFGHAFFRQSFFRGQGWCERWAIAVTTGLRGVSFWVAEINDDGTPIRSVQTAVSIQPSCNIPEENPMNLRFFRKLEKIAVAVISLYTTSRQLKRLVVPHTIRKHNFRQTLANANLAQTSPRQHQYVFPVMYIKLSALMRQRKQKVSLISDFLRLAPQNYIIRKDGKMTYVVMGIMRQPKSILNILTHMRDRDVIFQDSGGFAIFLHTNFGAPFVDQLVDRLEHIERLSDVVQTLDIWDLNCRLVSLSRIIVRYYGGFFAELDFQQTRAEGDRHMDDKAAPLPIRVKFEGKNPHKRVQAFLESILTDRESGINDFACALSKTFPLLRAFNTIENKTDYDDYQDSPERFNLTTSAADRRASDAKDTGLSSSHLPSSSTYPLPHSLSYPSIHARNFDWFRLSYANPRCTFDIRLRQAMEKVFWHIEETSKKEWYANAKNSNTANPAMNKPAATTTTTTTTSTSTNNPNATKPGTKDLTNPSNPSTTTTASHTAIPSTNLGHRPASLTPALKQLFAQRGPDWMGMRKCVIAGVKGVEQFVEKLDKVVRDCAVVDKNTGNDVHRANADAEAGAGDNNNNNNSNNKIADKGGAGEIKTESSREVVVLE